MCHVSILDRTRVSELTARIVGLFAGVEGIKGIVMPADFPQHGLPRPEDHPGVGDVMLLCREGYVFSNNPAGDAVVTPVAPVVKGAHGYEAGEPRMHAAFVAWGTGIRPGVVLDRIDNVDVAPTMAAVLGLTMPADGRVLRELLAP